MRRAFIAGVGGVTAALLGALCCVGPLLFVAFGVGAGLASTFEPLRPLFGGIMIAAFALGFHTIYRRSPAPVPSAASAGGDASACTVDGGTTGAAEILSGATCAVPRRRTRDAIVLWTALVLAVILWTFPSWSLLFV
jgi:hypothetical protein